MNEDVRQEIERELEQLAEAIVDSEGMELVSLEYQREGRGWVVRLFIDKEGGVTVDDCALISRQVGDILDVKDIVPQSYLLEVSSPGLNRPLRKMKDFARFAGRKVKVRLTASLEGRKNITGDLLGVEEDTVLVAAADRQYSIPVGLIAKARLVYEYDRRES
ncbi:MAG: ribosome maturation factor RimP [Deltaproteobacteria bacterium]|nr:ribosome maturation factor RimP [Deltaproteobacteria bacterium]